MKQKQKTEEDYKEKLSERIEKLKVQLLIKDNLISEVKQKQETEEQEHKGKQEERMEELNKKIYKKENQISELKPEAEEQEHKYKIKVIVEPLDRKNDQIAKPKVEPELLTQEHKDLIEEQNETIEKLRREIDSLIFKKEPRTWISNLDQNRLNFKSESKQITREVIFLKQKHYFV